MLRLNVHSKNIRLVLLNLSLSILLVPVIVHGFFIFWYFHHCFQPFLSPKRGKQCHNILNFPAEIGTVNESWRKINFPNNKNVCRVHFILLFDIFYWFYWVCIVYLEQKYFIDPLYFPELFINPNSTFPKGEKLRKCHSIFTKIVMGNLGMSGDSFQKSLAPW